MLLHAPTFADPDHADSQVPEDDDPSGYADVDGPPPPGLALANAVVAGLTAAGVSVPNRWTTYEGHGWDARVDTWRYDMTLTLADQEEGHWILASEPRRGLMPWSRRTPPAAATARLASALESVIEADPRLARV